MNSQKTSCGLIIVDIQGKLAGLVKEGENLQARVLTLVTLCHAQQRPVILCEQMPEKLGATVPAIANAAGCATRFQKSTFNAMLCADFKAAALSEKQWAVAGIESHICVYQTVMGLLKEGIDVSLITDAVASRHAGDRDVAIQAMQAAGANLKTTEMQIYEWLERADDPLYKQMLPLIKALPAN
ncbi:isochorismatase family protein [Alteromonas sp. H39]|uniref:isochorismatase family protein n=1 Tax=Alteromonas sp. H39 TaxID=3389876 RepID=UPI0039E1CC45